MRRLPLLLFSIFIPSATMLARNPTVPGDVAVVINGIAHAPENAPLCIKNAIWAVNTIVRKPYRWGGGHSTFFDVGYDCSGTVSFMLHHAGVLATPTPSKGLLSWGKSGSGRWITVYTRAGHAFAIVAGLRLDTTGNSEREGPRWQTASRDLSKFVARHPEGL